MPAVMCAAALTVVALVLSTYIVPAAVRGFKDLQWVIRTDMSQILLREGAFNALGQGLTVYVRARSTNGELLDLMVNDARQPLQPVTLLAGRGEVLNGPNGSRVILHNGSRQERKAEGTLSVLYFETYALELGQIDPPPGTRTPDNRERGTFELLRLGAADAFMPDAIARMRSEGHQRLASPLTVLGYALLAAA